MAAAPGEMSNALYGAYRLARIDPQGMDYFRNTPGAFWRSFKAALIIAPFYIALLMMRYESGEVSTPFIRYAAVEIIAYVIAWFAFPVLMDLLTKALDRREKYIRFIIAYNWAAVLQNLLYLPFAMLSVNGVLPEGSVGMLGMSVLIIIMSYTFYITKVALDLPGSRAFSIVAIDFTLSLLINGYAEKLL